jgi:hypothetical protein
MKEVVENPFCLRFIGKRFRPDKKINDSKL